MSHSYTIIKDTREQSGYHFRQYDTCEGMIEKKLDTGDYSIVGLEDKICIERKGCIEELALNLGQKKKTFMKEIERMKAYEHKFLVLEFDLQDLLSYPFLTNIPIAKRNSIRLTGKYLLKCLMEIEINYNVHILFCGNKQNAFLMVSSLLKRLSEKYDAKH